MENKTTPTLPKQCHPETPLPVGGKTNQSPKEIQTMARVANCHWRFLQQWWREQQGQAPAETTPLNAYLRILGAEQQKHLAEKYQEQGITYRENWSLETPTLKGEIPVAYHSANGWVIVLPRYSAHVRRDSKIYLAGLVALAREAQIPLASQAEVHLSNGKTVEFETIELLPLWEQQIDQAQQLLNCYEQLLKNLQQNKSEGAAAHRLTPPPTVTTLGLNPLAAAELWYRCQRVCGNCSDCQTAKNTYQDLLLISGLGGGLREHLHERGIYTLQDLVAAQPADLNPRLLRQACLQETVRNPENCHRSNFPSQSPGGPVIIEEYTDQKIAYQLDRLAPIWQGIPAPDPADIYLDFENDSLWGWDQHDHTGLVYLAGLSTWNHRNDWKTPGSPHYSAETSQPTGSSPSFFPPGRFAAEQGMRYLSWWAYDRNTEKQLLQNLVKWLLKRWRKHPELHVYHYSEQEKLYLRRLAARHGTCEKEVASLTGPDGIFVDLLQIVQATLVSSLPGHSLKDLEPLYFTAQQRGGKVQDGGESVVYYHQWWEQYFGGDRAANADLKRGTGNAVPSLTGLPDVPVLREIAAYNEYDCVSTWGLHDWLLRQRLTGR